MSKINTRECRLMQGLTLRTSKGLIAKAYCEKFGVTRDTFHRRLRQIELSPPEKAFFEEYFTKHVTGGAELLKKVNETLKSDS